MSNPLSDDEIQGLAAVAKTIFTSLEAVTRIRELEAENERLTETVSLCDKELDGHISARVDAEAKLTRYEERYHEAGAALTRYEAVLREISYLPMEKDRHGGVLSVERVWLFVDKASDIAAAALDKGDGDYGQVAALDQQEKAPEITQLPDERYVKTDGPFSDRSAVKRRGRGG